jgi:hypothetical protein
MGLLRWCSIESKAVELVVEGSFSMVWILQRCRGIVRPIYFSYHVAHQHRFSQQLTWSFLMAPVNGHKCYNSNYIGKQGCKVERFMIGWWISLTSFFNLLYLVQVRWEGEDKLWWAPSKRGLLDVRFFYGILICGQGFFLGGKLHLPFLKFGHFCRYPPNIQNTL